MIMLLTTLAAVHAAQAMVATEPRSVLNEMQAAGAAVDATGFRAPRAACLEATEWEAPPEGIEREQWESIDGRERLAVKLARSWAGVDDYETPEAPPDPLRPVYWDIDELRSLATPAATARARRDRRRRDKLRAMVDASSAAKIDAAVDLVDARAARGNFGARGAARVRNVAGTLVAGALVATSTLPPAAAEEIGRSPPFRMVFVVAALAALACRGPTRSSCRGPPLRRGRPKWPRAALRRVARRDLVRRLRRRRAGAPRTTGGIIKPGPALRPRRRRRSERALLGRRRRGGAGGRGPAPAGATLRPARLRRPSGRGQALEAVRCSASRRRAVPRRGKAGPREAPVGDGRRARGRRVAPAPRPRSGISV